MANNALQGVYSPLPQSLSDSDSEKDHEVPTRLTFSTHKLQNGHDLRSNGYKIPNHSINMKGKHGFRDMSLTRKCAFISSICLCFLCIIVFLWVLPCNTQGTCPAHITSWKNEIDGWEFKGKVNVVRDRYGSGMTLAVITKKSLIPPYGQGGAVALQSNSGNVIWSVPQVRTPMELNCNLIDVNFDEVFDCLLLGEIGLEAIDSLTGEVIWHVHSQKMIVNNLDFPKILPDLNHDKIKDMLTVTNFNSLHNKIILICGRTGKIITNLIVNECKNITHLIFEEEFLIYTCLNETDQHFYKINLSELKNKINNNSYSIKPVKIEYQSSKTNDYILNGRKLLIVNKGVCPDCHTNITLVEENTNRKLYDWFRENTYAIKAVAFSFQPTKGNLKSLKGHINGFILKLWQWPDYFRNKRSVQENNGSTIIKNNISEKVVLITFNDTDVLVINVSLVPITQLCFPFPSKECQPDLLNRNDSILISDLDGDGSQELISYSTSFRCLDDKNDNCQLVSNMEVIRLETELPKLYAK